MIWTKKNVEIHDFVRRSTTNPQFCFNDNSFLEISRDRIHGSLFKPTIDCYSDDGVMASDTHRWKALFLYFHMLKYGKSFRVLLEKFSFKCERQLTNYLDFKHYQYSRFSTNVGNREFVRILNADTGDRSRENKRKRKKFYF